MKTIKTLTALAMLSLVMACATATLSPEGERVRVVTDRADVEGCELVGVVEVERKFSAGEMLYVLRNKTAAMKADTLLVPKGASMFPAESGNAYRCGSK
jgi:hypothetical protein